jgi:hypothetical protein
LLTIACAKAPIKFEPLLSDAGWASNLEAFTHAIVAKPTSCLIDYWVELFGIIRKQVFGGEKQEVLRTKTYIR